LISGCLSVLVVVKLFQITTPPTVFSNSREAWHTWSMCQHAKKIGTEFQKFDFKNFGE